MSHNAISSIESGDFSGLTNLTTLDLSHNAISSIESGDFSGLTNLRRLGLSYNQIETMDLSSSDLSSLTRFGIGGNPLTIVLLNGATLNQSLLSTLLDGGSSSSAYLGIGELPGVTNLDLSGVDFVDVTDLSPLGMMDDLTDLWLVGALNVDAGQFDSLLNNLDTIEGTAVEGVLHLSQADYDALNVGGLLAAWDDEDGHHVQIIGSRISDRYAIYNNAVFDAGPNESDDAIAADKRPLLPGDVASFENCTSFVEGINGIIIDLEYAENAADITVDDFEFHVGNDEDPDSWDAAPTPTVTVRPGEGDGGSDRIVLVWPDGSIENQWLEVTVKATENTGLSEEDVFYFGNAIGETGDSGNDMLVNAADGIGIRDNLRGELNPAGTTDPYDLNRDGLVDAVDLIIARDGATSPLAVVRLLDLSATSAAPMPVPEPCTLALATFGLLGLSMFRRRIHAF